jgi:hypothetical protein
MELDRLSAGHVGVRAGTDIHLPPARPSLCRTQVVQVVHDCHHRFTVHFWHPNPHLYLGASDTRHSALGAFPS